MISTGRISVAQSILNLVLAREEVHHIDGHVDTFCNGREQGFTLCFFQGSVRAISFSEHRNTDCIVVYHSSEHESGGVFGYSDQFWDSRRLFDYGDYVGAVNYILELMVGESKED
ncbi:hypothetical protein KIOSHI_167 [Bacillus phage Kioshi]|nr:hypothetical protein KIOSHI_167 [Bacillus phage Kioshi]